LINFSHRVDVDIAFLKKSKYNKIRKLKYIYNNRTRGPKVKKKKTKVYLGCLGTKQLKGKKQKFLLINSKGISHKRGRRQKKKKKKLKKYKNSLTLSLYLSGLPHCTFSISLHTIEKQEKNQLNLIFYIFTYKHRTQKSSSSTVS